MYNWSVDEEKFKEENIKEYKIWKLEQLINFGLGKEKLDRGEVKKYLNKLRIDKEKKRYLKFLLS